ncbi:MAG: substrate-binding domain-containing protein [Lachnospiraceae bacterium]|nr:substrate-binding domain-containing protein [Lachnospiraceae bacterium]
MNIIWRRLSYVFGILLAATVFVWMGGSTVSSQTVQSWIPVNREPGSGTRSMFYSLVLDKKECDLKVPTPGWDTPAMVGSSEEMLQQIALTKRGIGYVTTGELNAESGVKTLKVDDTSPTADNIKSGAYPLSRELYLVWDQKLSAAEQDFAAYVKSSRAVDVIEESAYVFDGKSGEYEGKKVAGEIMISGSTSMTPLLRKLAADYELCQPRVTVIVRATDSEAGLRAVEDGSSDFAMVSRELSRKESNSFQAAVLARDGIAIIVNQENVQSKITTEELRTIFEA